MIVPGRWIFTPSNESGMETIAVPARLPVTSRSPMATGCFVASTLTFTRPTVAIISLDAEDSPRINPGDAETTPATEVSYGFVEGITRFDCFGSRMTTVPGTMSVVAGTHPAGALYTPPPTLLARVLPATSRFFAP